MKALRTMAVLLVVGMAYGVSGVSLVRVAKVSAIATRDLEQVIALGCDECCDDNGGDKCAALMSTCVSERQDAVGWNGWKCQSEHSECSYTPDSNLPNNAKCEWDMGIGNAGACTELPNTALCKDVMAGICDTKYFNVGGSFGGSIFGVTGIVYVEVPTSTCGCAEGAANGTGYYSRTFCTAQNNCWW